MKLARVIRSAEGVWQLVCPSGSIRRPPLGTLVQYERDVNDWYSVYFPGVRGYAYMSSWVFELYFEDLDNETS